MKFINADEAVPRIPEHKDELFLVSDGINFSIARWANLCDDDSECGADQDEYELKKDTYPYVKIKFWCGPLNISQHENIENWVLND
jgi:hypothetical protein